MSSNPDERVVGLKFDNKQFEQGTKQSMSTIDKLKKSLNFEGVSKGLDNIGSSTKKIDMSGLGSAVEAVNVKFSALQVMAVTALSNITNSALNTGKQLISAFTIDPVKTGFQEYETQIGSVQTILANTSAKGTTLEQVNDALNTLNTYADKTIYNFTEMTRNIGTFTAAGVDLDTSVSAIQGIANVAAISGSTSEQASTAMYQLSQALASGTVKLMDWNSVVNAGMGGEVFQNALKETARVHGIAIDQMIEEEGSFRDTLSNGWLTSDVLTETLSKFTTSGVNEYLAKNSDLTADVIKKTIDEAASIDDASAAIAQHSSMAQEDIKSLIQMADTAEGAATNVKTFSQLMDTLKEAVQSGWTQTWQTIIGDYTESKALFTDISNTLGGIISSASNARNNLLTGALSDNWGQLSDKISNTGIDVDDFQSKLIDTAKAHGIAIDDMISKEGSFSSTLKSGWLTGDLISETLGKYVGSISSVGTAVDDTASQLEKFQDVVNSVINLDYGSGQERIDALTNAGYDYATIQKLVNAQLNGTTASVADLSNAQLTNLGYTDDQIAAIKDLADQAAATGTPINDLINKMQKPSGRELLIDTLKNAFGGLLTSIKAVHTAYREIFPKNTSEQLYNIIEGVNNLSKNLQVSDEKADKIRRTFKGLFAIINIFTTLTGGALKIALKLIGKLLGLVDLDILDVTAGIGDAAVAFRDFLFENNFVIKGLEKLIGCLGTGIQTIKKWVSAFLELPIVQKNIATFSWAFSTTFSKIQDYLQLGIAKIKDFVEFVGNLDSLSLDNIGAAFDYFKENVLSYFINPGDIFKNIKDAVSDFKEDIASNFASAGTTFTNFKDTVSSVIDAIKKKLSGIGLGQILTIGLGAGLIVAVKEIIGIAKSFASPIEAIAGVLDNFSGVLKAYALEIKSKALLKVAIAIGILVASIAVLTLLDQTKMWSAIGAIALLGTVLVALSFAMSKISSTGGSLKTSVLVVGMAAAMLILVIALKQMESLDSDLLTRDLTVLGIMAVGLVALSAVLAKAAPQLSKGTLSMVGFAIALKILVSALSDMEGLDSDKVGSSVIILLGMMAGLVLIAKAAGKVSIGSSITIIAIVFALKILVGALDDISEMDSASIKRSMNVFVEVFGMFALLMAASSLAGKNASKAGVAILLMSVSMLILVQAFKMISGIPADSLDNALEAVSKILLIFGVLIAASNLAGNNAVKAGVMMLLMVGAITALSLAIVILSQIPADGLARAVAAITVIGVMFGAIIALTYFAKEAKTTLTLIAVTIGILAISLGALSMIEPAKLEAATIALTSVMGMFALLIFVSGMAQASIGPLVVMTLAVVALAGVLYLLSSLPAEETLSNAKALSILLLSLSASCLILTLVGTFAAPALAGVGVMTLVIAAVGGLLIAIGALMDNVPQAEKWLDAGLPVLEKIGYAIGSFIGNIIAGLAAGAVSSLPEIGSTLSTFMDNAQPFFEGTKNIDTGAMAGINSLADAISTLNKTDVSDIENVGSQLVDLGGYMVDYSNSIIGMNPDAVKASGVAAKSLAELADALPNEGGYLSAWVGDNKLSTFADELEPFGKAMTKYGESVKDLKVDAVTSSATAGKAIAELADALPNEGGKLAWFVGDNKLSTYADELEPFGKAMTKYGESVKDLKVDAVVNSATAGKAIGELADALPNEGGALKWWVGDNKLSTYADELEPFGKAMTKYGESVKDLKVDAIVNSATAGKSIAELANNLPNEGGALKWWVGDNKLSTYADELEPFGKAMADYGNAVKDLKIDAVTNSTTAASALSELAKGLPNEGGLGILFSGDNSIKTFGTNLISFGTDFADYSDAMSTVNSGTVNSTTAAAQAIVELQNSLPEGKWYKADSSLSDFGSDLSSFGYYMNQYYGDISDIDSEQLSSVISQVNRLISMADRMGAVDSDGISNFGESMGQIGSTGVSEFIKAFENSAKKVTSAATKMVETFINGAMDKRDSAVKAFDSIVKYITDSIESKYDQFKSIGSNTISNMTNGINTSSSGLSNAYTLAMFTALSNIRGYYSSFYESGSYLVGGFVKGTIDKISQVADSSKQMAYASITAARKTLDEHSPSRVFYKIADLAATGYINAMSDNVSNSYKAGSNLARASRDGLSSAISKVVDVLDNELDTSPVIRPVLDLSNIQAGTGLMNNLLANNSVGYTASLVPSTTIASANSISMSMQRNQNGDNDDVISAINKLNNSLQTPSVNTYTVNGVTYDDGSNISGAVKDLIHAAKIGGRI